MTDPGAESRAIQLLPIARAAVNAYRHMAEQEVRTRTTPMRYHPDTQTFDPTPPGEWGEKFHSVSNLFAMALALYAQGNDDAMLATLTALLDMAQGEERLDAPPTPPIKACVLHPAEIRVGLANGQMRKCAPSETAEYPEAKAMWMGWPVYPTRQLWPRCR